MYSRLRGDVDGKDMKNLPPLVTGGLSPIIDIDEDMKDISGKFTSHSTQRKYTERACFVVISSYG